MPHKNIYPSGAVLKLLNTDAVTSVTAKALNERLQKAETAPCFFSGYNYHLLTTVCDRLLDQQTKDRMVNIAAFIDERLANGVTDGWRFDNMPPDKKMYINGLRGIDETARSMFDAIFTQLTREKQTTVLKTLQNGTAAGIIWKQMSSITFFEELLAEAAEIFYAHPLAQEEIGYAGMADAYGWTKIGLNEKEAIEPIEQ